MFGRTVTIDGTEVFVSCLPTTPYSEICLRAAKLFKIEEEHDTKLQAISKMKAEDLTRRAT
jgi:hypothetical protein